MVAPIKGPFQKHYGAEDSGSFYKKRTWYTQAKPYVLPLTFELLECQRTAFRGPPGTRSPWPIAWLVFHGDLPASMGIAAIDNRCREKLYGKLGESVDMSTNIAERHQAVGMMVRRLTQLRRAFVAVRKGRFKEASRVLGLDHTPRRVSAKKQVSNNWLEYHFGWSPLLKDIHSAVDVMQGPVAERTVRASAKSSGYQVTSGGYPRQPQVGQQASFISYTYEVRSGFSFKITNPDLWLANRLGLINPATVAWELVPFSFVVDWFVPIGDFLGSMTATLGLSVERGWTGRKSTKYDVLLQSGYPLTPGGPNQSYVQAGHGTHASRSIGALSPTPTLTVTNGFSPIRAFTALTLLVQQMKGR